MNRQSIIAALIVLAVGFVIYGPLHRPLRAAASGRVRLTASQKQIVLGGECYGAPCSMWVYPEYPIFPDDYGGCWATYTEGDFDNDCDAKGCSASGCGSGYVQWSQNFYLIPTGTVESCSIDAGTCNDMPCSRSIECVSEPDDELQCDNGKCADPFTSTGCYSCSSRPIGNGEWSNSGRPCDIPCQPSGS